MRQAVRHLRTGKGSARPASIWQLHWLHWLAILIALLPLVARPATRPATQPPTLFRLLQDSQSRDYRPLAPAEAKQVEYLFRQAFNGAARPEQRAAWAALGFQVERVTENQRVFTVIREQPNRRQGRGLYIFAKAAVGAPILQAPQIPDDKHTGAIGIALMAEGRFTASAWSTAPRPRQNDDDEAVTGTDSANPPDSYLIAFSRAAAVAQPTSAILQLHGFNTAKRKTEAGRRASVIVSAGQREATPAAEQTVRCLRELIGSVLLYPQDTKELGALTNPVGEALRGLGRTGFVRVEMAPSLREKLYADPALRQRFGGCLAAVRP